MQPCLLCSLPQSYPAATCCREPPSGSPPSLSTVIEGFYACTQGLIRLAAAPSGLHIAERLLLCLPVALGQHKPVRRHCYIFLRVGCSPSAALPLSVHVSSTSASCDCDLPAALELSRLQQLTSGCTCQAAEVMKGPQSAQGATEHKPTSARTLLSACVPCLQPWSRPISSRGHRPARVSSCGHAAPPPPIGPSTPADGRSAATGRAQQPAALGACSWHQHFSIGCRRQRNRCRGQRCRCDLCLCYAQ